MVKKINVNVIYKNNHRIIECKQDEFARQVFEKFKVDIRNVALFNLSKGIKKQISFKDVTDFMKIELVDKKNDQRVLPSYFNNNSDSEKMAVEGIIVKLKENSPLTGQQRKILIDALEAKKLSICRKRKLDDTDGVAPKPSTSNKKIQANLNGKESSTQTDSSEIQLNGVEENEDLNTVIDKLKRLAGQESPKKEQEEEIDRLMRLSYEARRHFIFSKRPLIQEIREKYPTLFTYAQVTKELDRIFTKGTCDEFKKNIAKYSKIIINFMDKKDELLIRIEKARQRATTQRQKDYAYRVGSILALAKSLNEGFGFVHLIDHPEEESDDAYPFIDARFCSLKELFIDEPLFHITVEGQHLCIAEDFEEAILCLVACFYIFDISYPERNVRTLILFEKLYLCGNETKEMDNLTSQMVKLLRIRAADETKL